MRSYLRLILRVVLSTIIAILLWMFSEALGFAIKTSLLTALGAGFIGLLCLVISYGQHRHHCQRLASEASRLSKLPDSDPAEWQKMLYQSKSAWKQSPKVWVVLVGIFSWGMTSFLSALIGKDSADFMPQISGWSSFVGHLILNYLQETQEQAEFQLSIAAANKGGWFPSMEDPKKERSASTKVKDFATELPTKLLQDAVDTVEGRITPER